MLGFGKKVKLGMVALMLSTASFAPSYGETLNDALGWAYQNNPELNATRAGVRQALEGIEQAKSGKRLQYDASGSLSASNYDDGTGGRDTSQSLSAELSASLLLWDGGQTDLAIDSALAQVQASKARLAATEQQILLATVQAYLAVLEKQQNVELQKSNSEILQKQVRSANISFEEGAATLAEVSAAKATAASADAQIALAEAELISAQQDYVALTGKKPGKLASVNAPKIPSSASAVEAEALKNSPTIIAALETERAAMLDYRRAQRNSSATVSASASAKHADTLDGNDATDTLSAGVYVNVPLGTGGKNPSLERQAKALLEQRSQETNSARLSAAKTAQVAFAQYQSAVNGAKAYDQVVNAQSVANEGAAIEFELGASTILDKLEAEQDLLSARTDQIQASFNQTLAAFNVLAAMGKMKIGDIASGVKNIDPVVPVSAPVEVKSENAQAVERLQDRWGN